MGARTTWSGGVKTLVGFAVIFALGVGTLLPGTAVAESHCGKAQSLGMEPIVSTVSCQKAIGVVAGYERSGMGSIYFWANLTNPIKSSVPGIKNPPVIRPSSLLIFQDGSWLIEGLRWTGWGSPVAVAHGKSNADTDKPNVAEGKRIITPAKVVLYDPGVFEGRRVYRCIRMKLRPPAKFPPQCLQRSGGIVALGPHGFGTPVGGGAAEGGARHIDDFFSADRKIWCQISRIDGASCGTDPAPPTHSASLDEDGKVEICSVEKLEYPGGPGRPPLGCFQQWPDEMLPILREGEVTTVAGIRCSAEPMGITCVKTSGQGKGRGFRINADLAAELTSALRSTPPPNASFDRRDPPAPGIFAAKGPGGVIGVCDMYLPEIRGRGILCVSDADGTPHRTSEAILFADGTVRICSYPTSCHWVVDDPEAGPPLRPGQSVKDPPFHCRVSSKAIRCTLIGSRRGFLIDKKEARRLGPTSTSMSGAIVPRLAPRRCGSVTTGDGATYDMTIVKGSPSCSTVRRLMKGFGHPISKKPRFYCGVKGYECEYSIYPEGWRCGGFFQGHFQCWHGANDPARADEIFEGVDALEDQRPRRLELASARPACTKRALTKGLHRAGLPGHIDRDSFACAGNFAYAEVIIGRDAATVLFRAHGQGWHPADRGIYCENGSVPKAIYRQGCETN